MTITASIIATTTILSEVTRTKSLHFIHFILVSLWTNSIKTSFETTMIIKTTITASIIIATTTILSQVTRKRSLQLIHFILVSLWTNSIKK
jgi:hypothetical protein